MNRSLLMIAAAAVAATACEGGEQQIAVNEAGNQASSANEMLPGGGAVKPAGAAVIQVASKEPYGQYLVDGSGRAIYVLEGNRAAGPGGGEPRNRCIDACLETWPPVTTNAAPTAAEGVDAAKLATVTTNGSDQVAYAGWPLYYYRGDRSAGSTSGQEVHDRWGGWYLLSPQGERIEGREMGPSAQ